MVALVLSAPPSVAKAPRKIRAAALTLPVFNPIIVSLMKDQAIDARHGLDMEVKPYPLGLDAEGELYAYRPAFEADPDKVEPLATAISRAHQAIRGGAPKPAAPPFSSMWRDTNCFNEMRIPAITYGPGISVGGGNFGMKIADLVTARSSMR